MPPLCLRPPCRPSRGVLLCDTKESARAAQIEPNMILATLEGIFWVIMFSLFWAGLDEEED